MGSATQETPAKPEIAVTSIRTEREKLDRFKRVAAAHRRSVSQELRWLMDRAVEEHEAKAA